MRTVSQGGISSDFFTRRRTEIESADQTCSLAQLKDPETGPTCPSRTLLRQATDRVAT